MTRMLSELLGAREPDFSLNIKRLERASGDPSADIRLSSEIQQRTFDKIRELGLDPNDTTGLELYGVLQERLKADEWRVRQALRIADEADGTAIASAVAQFIRKLDMPKSCFALKASAAKRLLKAQPPKKAMQSLGYRSIDSFLKHEPAALAYAAAWGKESAQWRRNFIKQYAALAPGDFESREIALIVPTAARWKTLAGELAASLQQSSMYFKELGDVVLLPLPAVRPGLALVSLLFALRDIEEIRSASAFLKLQQVKPDFGMVVAQTAMREPSASAAVAGQSLPWRLVQHYFGAAGNSGRADVFEPHVQAEDLEWQHTEEVLARALPQLAFWADSYTLGLSGEQLPISLNIFDVALSYCNQLPFGDRIVHFLRDNVRHELLLRYMHEDSIEQTVTGQLGSQLVGEPLLA